LNDGFFIRWIRTFRVNQQGISGIWIGLLGFSGTGTGFTKQDDGMDKSLSGYWFVGINCYTN